MKKFILAVLVLLFPVVCNGATKEMPVTVKCRRIASSPITYLCSSTNLYRYKFRPLWVVRDYRDKIVDQTYGTNAVEIFPQPGPFSIEVFRTDGLRVKESIVRAEVGYGR